jgi:hypothetical protein
MSCIELHITSDDIDQVCLVDEADYLLISQYHWNIVNGYVKSGRTLMHRLILDVTDPNKHIDHIDHNRLNNQRSNLRICTRSENQHNRVKQKSTSQFKGVTKYAGRWFAQIRNNNQYIYLGLFKNEITAAKAYDRASRELHKDFGLTNFEQVENLPKQLDLLFKNTTAARRTSIRLIQSAVSEGWIKQLAFYHLLKYNFNNSCIYAYRSRMNELAAQFDISTKTLYNYLNFLRTKNLIYDHSINLKLKSIREYKARRMKAILLMDDSHDLFDISCLLYAKLIEKKIQQMAFMESVKTANKRKSPRMEGGDDKFDNGLCGSPFHPSLSYRRLAKLLNCSECKSFKIVSNLNKLQKAKLISKDFKALNLIEDFPGHRFNLGNNLFELNANKIELLQYPVYLKRVSYKQQKRAFCKNHNNLLNDSNSSYGKRAEASH